MVRNQDLENPLEILDSSSSSSEEEISLGSDTSDSDSDSDSRTESDDLSLYVVKPIASKPLLISEGGRNPRSEASGSKLVKSGGLKRSAVEKESGIEEGKKLKKVVENSEKNSNKDSKKKQQLSRRRRWTEGEEIEILEGMINFLKKKKSEGRAKSLKGFYEFIKGDLDVEIRKAQLKTKMQKLKMKYEKNKSKEKEGKVRMVHSQSHEDRAFELSKLVWGNGNGKETSGRKTEKNLGDGDGGREKEWRKLRIMEMEIYLKKLDLMHAQMQSVLDALKKQ